MTPSTAAVLVVGSEVLSAKVEDANGPYLVKRLRDLGVELIELHVVPDRMDAIVETLLAARRRADWVLTSGGVGPTHDDLTVPAVARALGVGLHRDDRMARVLREMHARHHPGAEFPEVALRMADLPEGTELLGDPEFPTLVVSRVVMLPGVPSFLRHQFQAVTHLFHGAPFQLACLYFRWGEDRLAVPLAAVAEAHPSVEVGSYPRFDESEYRVKVTVEGRNRDAVRAAAQAVLAAVPALALVRTEGLDR